MPSTALARPKGAYKACVHQVAKESSSKLNPILCVEFAMADANLRNLQTKVGTHGMGAATFANAAACASATGARS